jgi:hypothetical protein
MTDAPRNWVIFEHRSELYWRENACGYGRLEDAGLFTEAEAKRYARDPDRRDEAMPLSSLAKVIITKRDQIARLVEALNT